MRSERKKAASLTFTSASLFSTSSVDAVVSVNIAVKLGNGPVCFSSCGLYCLGEEGERRGRACCYLTSVFVYQCKNRSCGRTETGRHWVSSLCFSSALPAEAAADDSCGIAPAPRELSGSRTHLRMCHQTGTAIPLKQQTYFLFLLLRTLSDGYRRKQACLASVWPEIHLSC